MLPEKKKIISQRRRSTVEASSLKMKRQKMTEKILLPQNNDNKREKVAHPLTQNMIRITCVGLADLPESER